jgi:hypothetical protein
LKNLSIFQNGKPEECRLGKKSFAKLVVICWNLPALITFVGSNAIGSYLVDYRINLINGRKQGHRIFVKKFDDPQVELIRIIETKLDAAQKN